MRTAHIAVVSVLLAACQCGTPTGNDGGGGGSAGGVGGGTAGGAGGGTGGSGGGSAGGSGCSPLQLTCSGQCVSPRVDPNNCGACGLQCDGGTVCSAGLCVGSCQTPLQACAGRCVDTAVDNEHCGGCNSPCTAPLGCVGGQCRATVPVGPAPARCTNGGPPIFVGDAGAADCAGNLAARTFRYALCSCGGLSLSNLLYTDGYDSTHGPYRDAGVGASVGTNGALSAAGSSVTVGGTLWVSGSGISMSSDLVARQELHCAGTWGSRNPLIGGDAYVGDDITVTGTGSVGGTLRLPAGATITGTLTTGATVRTPVTVDGACDCSASARVPVAAIVAAHATNNDNAAIGLDAGVFAGVGAPLRLDLPCGHYFLTNISTSAPVAIITHGNTALYINGDISSNSVTITPDPLSQLDVFVAGSVSNSGGLRLGSPNFPAQLRVYVGNGVHFAGGNANTFAGNIYVVNDYTASSPGLYYGALMVGSYSNSSTTTIHYDRAVLGQTRLCTTDGGQPGGCSSCRDCNNQACNSGTCGACSANADCCAPLICNAGRCEPAACTGNGGGCTTSDTCCNGFWCVDEHSNLCAAGAACVCSPMFQ